MSHQLFMALYYLTFYFTAVRFKSPVDSGLDLFPATFLILPGSAVVSALVSRLGKFRWAVWFGWAFSTIGAGLFVLWDAKTKTAVWATSLCIFGVGMGMVLSSVNFAVQAIAQTEDAGRAAAMYAFVRTVGMTVGVAVGGTVMQNLMRQDLQKEGLPTEIAKNAEAYVATLRTLKPTDPAQTAILHAYVHGFRGIFEVMAATCAFALLLSLCIKHHDMNKMLQSKHKLERQSS